MRLFVTGHAGYIGAVLVPMLLDRGHEVTGLDSDLFARCTFAGDLATVPAITQDIRDFVADREQAIDMLSGHDAIIHLAGLSNDPLGDYAPHLTDEINAQASIALARLAKDAGVPRFLYASSCSNYGASGDDFIDEDGAFNPVTPYGRSKVDAEAGIAPLADDAFSPAYLRASTAYGCSPRLRFDLVVNNLTAWAFTTGEVHLKSDGSPWRPLVHVADIAQAYVALAEAPRDSVHGRAFNIGQTSENYRVIEIARLVEEIVPGAKIGFADGASPDTRNYRVSCERLARNVHGWKPQWTVRRGIEELLAAFQANGLSLEDFEGETYKRIAHVRGRIARGEINEDLRPAEARP